jgi:hypothetical protein
LGKLILLFFLIISVDRLIAMTVEQIKNHANFELVLGLKKWF